MKHVLLAAIPALLLTSAAHATDATGQVSATVLQSLAISQIEPLSFGSFTPGSAAPGTINTKTGEHSPNINTFDLMSPGSFHVTGNPSSSYTISGDATTSIGDGLGHSMNVDLSYPADATSRALNGGGEDDFPVNGILHVGTNQVAGNYTGQYTVSVNY